LGVDAAGTLVVLGDLGVERVLTLLQRRELAVHAGHVGVDLLLVGGAGLVLVLVQLLVGAAAGLEVRGGLGHGRAVLLILLHVQRQLLLVHAELLGLGGHGGLLGLDAVVAGLGVVHFLL